MNKISISRFLLLTMFAMSVVLSGCDAIFDLLVSPEVSVGTHELAFTAVEGGDAPEAQKTTAECSTSNSSTESIIDKDECTVDITSNQDWLTVAPTSVTGYKEISVSVNTTGLKEGTYTGKIHVEYDLVAIDDEEDIDVTLTVTAPVALVAPAVPPPADSATKSVKAPEDDASDETPDDAPPDDAPPDDATFLEDSR